MLVAQVALCRLAAPKITNDMVIAIDPGDIRKKYAQKMEFLARIRDGSERRLMISSYLSALDENSGNPGKVSYIELVVRKTSLADETVFRWFSMRTM